MWAQIPVLIAAVRPDSASNKDIGPKDAPAGTFTFISVELEDSTVARVAPKLTRFFSASRIKVLSRNSYLCVYGCRYRSVRTDNRFHCREKTY